MAKHAQTDTGQRMRRTVAAVALGAIAAAVTLVGVLPEVLNLIHEGLGDFLPEGARAWLVATAGFTAALSITINRLMMLPGLAPWLESVGLGKRPVGAGESD